MSNLKTGEVIALGMFLAEWPLDLSFELIVEKIALNAQEDIISSGIVFNEYWRNNWIGTSLDLAKKIERRAAYIQRMIDEDSIKKV